LSDHNNDIHFQINLKFLNRFTADILQQYKATQLITNVWRCHTI